jgi:endonuclease G
MDYRQVFTDSDLKDEFLDKFDALKGHVGGGNGGLESLEGGLTVDDAAARVQEIEEGTWQGSDPGLEAIIERFTRPVYLVQDDTFGPPPDDFEDSDFIAEALEGARSAIEPSIPSVGRVDLRNHSMQWVGTGWVVAPGVVATNRHVAQEFARADGDGFVARTNFMGSEIRATMDWFHEHERPGEARFRVKKILWIEPDEGFDVALLGISDLGEEDEEQPQVIDLLDEEEMEKANGLWVGVIGYPARDSRNDFADQQRIFDGIYNVKRLAPGKVTAVRDDGLLEHDATTLGGNSGSVVIELDSGKAAAIHFGGIEGSDNFGVQAPRIAQIVADHAS